MNFFLVIFVFHVRPDSNIADGIGSYVGAWVNKENSKIIKKLKIKN
jgi:hypothetical protein